MRFSQPQIPFYGPSHPHPHPQDSVGGHNGDGKKNR